MTKKVIIIGGGISGLSAGIYAQQCGFETTILESHNIAGGNCTSWKRKDYLFEGGMHWLGGSKNGSVMNKLWRHVGALDDNVQVFYSEPFLEFNHQGTPIRLYRDVDKMENEWLKTSPVDEKEIKNFCNIIRKMKGLSMPITDLRKVKVTQKVRPHISDLFYAIRAFLTILKYSKISASEYSNRFSHKAIQEFFLSLSGDNQMITMLFMTMGFLANGDGGFPNGGSLPFVERMVNTYNALGGNLLLNTPAETILMENYKAIAVITKNKKYDADAVIIATDTMNIEKLFSFNLHNIKQYLENSWFYDMKKKTEPTSATLVSIGINADLSNYPERPIFKLETPIKLADKNYYYLYVNQYSHDRTYTPKGKTAITIQLSGDTYDFWKMAKENGLYYEEKDKLGKEIINELSKWIPEIENNVEVIDIATPITYEKYCDNWKGSWMTNISNEINFKAYPSTIKGLKGVYFSGHRMMPPGGLPPALMTARKAVQHLCRDTKTLFVSEV
ncbi:MAG: oleate hydratase [Candidatus Cloacimonetes bacterium]|nr:oleate hydratase [Candidatus Cloacimonadota bacterium]